MLTIECKICSGEADSEFKRREVWSNDIWRLTASTYKNVKGFCYLEPKRHIPYITDLDGIEAREFGSIISKITSAIKKACNAKLVYVYIFGGHIPHLHVHFAPHTDKDIYYSKIVSDENLIGEEILNQFEIDNLIKAISSNINLL